MRLRIHVAFPIIGALVLSGCASSNPAPVGLDTDDDSLPLLMELTVDAERAFEESVVKAAFGFTNDLYEPTIDVSTTGTIYVAGHTILADTTGAPAFVSQDDGNTWQQLPFAKEHRMPGSLHGGTPPPSDEIFIVAGDDGWAYGVDITLATFPVNAWSGDGATHAYHNPNAYDRAESTQGCAPASVNDRPWAAYANGQLLLVNNPGGGPVQIGAMQVPPKPVGDLGVEAGGVRWNTCASPGGWIPGIPDMRDDGLFIVPQMERTERRLVAVVGNLSDIFDVEVREITGLTSGGEITSNYGHAVFDGAGVAFVGAGNNSKMPGNNELQGRFILASSADNATTFHNRTFVAAGPVLSFYLDGNKAGTGALVVWSTPSKTKGKADWYVGHAQLGPDGAPVLNNVSKALEAGPLPSAHVTGAALGPDGRAYLAMYARGGPGTTPISVWIQKNGPTLQPLSALS